MHVFTCVCVGGGGYVCGEGGGGGSLQIGAFGILPIIMTIKPFPQTLSLYFHKDTRTAYPQPSPHSTRPRCSHL